MMTLNCTKKMAKRLPFPLTVSPQPSTNVLGPWCANTFNVGRVPLIILTNERTLLSVFIPLKEIRTFHDRFLDSLEILFHSIALSSDQIHREMEEMKTVQFTNQTNRTVLGSMNDFVANVRAFDPQYSLEEIAFELTEMPCGPLKHGNPREAVYNIL